MPFIRTQYPARSHPFHLRRFNADDAGSFPARSPPSDRADKWPRFPPSRCACNCVASPRFLLLINCDNCQPIFSCVLCATLSLLLPRSPRSQRTDFQSEDAEWESRRGREAEMRWRSERASEASECQCGWMEMVGGDKRNLVGCGRGRRGEGASERARSRTAFSALWIRTQHLTFPANANTPVTARRRPGRRSRCIQQVGVSAEDGFKTLQDLHALNMFFLLENETLNRFWLEARLKMTNGTC